MVSAKDFTGQNLGYVLELYDRFLESPDSVDAETAAFFQTWSPDSLIYDDVKIQTSNGELAEPTVDMHIVVGVVELVQAIRQFGHLAAKLDPLGSESPDDHALWRTPSWCSGAYAPGSAGWIPRRSSDPMH